MLRYFLIAFLAEFTVAAPRDNAWGNGWGNGWGDNWGNNWGNNRADNAFGRDPGCNVRRDSCLSDQGNVLKLTESTNWKSWAAVQSFSSSCDSLQNCYSNMGCRANEWDVLQHKRMMKTTCDRYLYMPLNFADCFSKLNNKNSQCWQSYVPVPHTSCSNLFGQDNCVKSDIVEVCGQDEWTRFRDNMIVLMTSMHPLCIFNTDI